MVGHITYVKSSPWVELHTFLLKVRCRRKYHTVWEIIPFDGGKIDKAMRNTLFVFIKKPFILKTTSLIIPDIIMVTATWQIPISWHPLNSNPKIDRQFESLKITKWSTTSWNNVSIFSGDRTPIWPRVKTLVPKNMYRKKYQKKKRFTVYNPSPYGCVWRPWNDIEENQELNYHFSPFCAQNIK